MSKPIKICKNYSNTQLKRVNESVENGVDKKYVFQGVFTACSTPEKRVINRNGRVYTSHEMLKHISYLRDAIKTQGCILGELDHPDGRFDVSLKEASHKIIDLWYDTKTQCVMGKLILLDTPNGKIAKEIVDAGYPLFVSSRAAGDVDEETREVEIAQIFTYDIVCTPGFEEARLDRVNESMSSKALKYINESVSAAKKVKNSISISEYSADYKIDENIARYKNSPVNMNAISKPLNEDTTEEFTLPEPETNPNKLDDKEDKKDGKEKTEVKDESPEKKEDLKDKKDISEEDTEAKEEKRKAILKIEAEDEDGNTINSDNETKSDSEQEENRAKILNIYTEEDDNVDEESDDASDENSEDSSEDNSASENEEDVQEAIDRKKKVTKETDKIVDDLDSLLDSVIKTESIKESIIRRYPFAVSLSSTNFSKFAALRPNQKKKCAEFIEEHQIYDINAINELWSTPLRQEKKLQQNWLRLASQHDIDLYTMASKEVQDAIEESAKYVVLETQEDVDDFWMRTGLRQAEARRMMNEQFVQTYKTASNSPYDQNNTNADNDLGYGYDFVQMVEDMMNAPVF